MSLNSTWARNFTILMLFLCSLLAWNVFSAQRSYRKEKWVMLDIRSADAVTDERKGASAEVYEEEQELLTTVKMREPIDVGEEGLPTEFKGDVRQLPTTSFRLISYPQLAEKAALFCSQERESCDRYEELKKQLEAQPSFVAQDARIHVILVDPLLWLRDHGENLYPSLSRSVASELTGSREHILFRGSDHLLVCLTEGCQPFAQEFGKLLSDGLGTRVMFAGVGINVSETMWPCPLRQISISREQLNEIPQLAKRILLQGTQMIEEKNRWICTGDSQPMYHYIAHNKSMSSGGMHNLLMCNVEKSGSTMTTMLIRRMLHLEDWRTINYDLPHKASKNGIVYMGNSIDFQLMERIYDYPSIVTATVVRHPIPRLLSGYLDKIVRGQEYKRIPKLKEYVAKNGVPSFPLFVEYLMKLYPDPYNIADGHFSIQSDHCGLRDHRIDFVGDLDRLGSEFEEFARSIGIWDDYVSTGWGEDRSQAFGKKSYDHGDHDHRSRALVWEHYTVELMRKVYDYYKDDFVRFGYTLEEILESKPDDVTAK